jgi:hypothetical protein
METDPDVEEVRKLYLSDLLRVKKKKLFEFGKTQSYAISVVPI